MTTRFMTKGKGQSRKIIPMKGRQEPKPKGIRRDVSEQFYDIPKYIRDITLYENERGYLMALHKDRQLLNHLRNIQAGLISNIGAVEYHRLVGLYVDVQLSVFDIGKYMRSKGIPALMYWLLSTSDKFKMMLRTKGLSDKDISDFMYLHGNDYKFTGIDGNQYKLRSSIFSRDTITEDMQPSFDRYLNMRTTFPIGVTKRGRYVKDDKRIDQLKTLSDKIYHKAYKDKRGYLKD
ncbi:hypothetical protein GQ472_01765 [archaeon]|nr:hypothetical protein [archaeon]